MNPFHILADYLRRWLLRRKAKRMNRSENRGSAVLHREFYSLQLIAEYFVGANDADFVCENVYLGWSASLNNFGEPNPVNRRFSDMEFESLNEPGRHCLADGDGEFLNDLTVSRIFGLAKLRFAPQMQGDGVFARPEVNEQREYLLYELTGDGQIADGKKARKLRRQPLYIEMEKNYMLTDENRSFTLKFSCCEKCCWQMPVS